MKKEDLEKGLIVVCLSDEASEFHNKIGEIVEWEIGHIYPRVKFNEPVSGKRLWYVPASQLKLAIPTNPQWEL